ncbi:phytochelatin synthase family protein [Lysobacter sp. M2-1]|uniref:phytochelatin synthase family protein n=1 Tax=Lysobacter sp. M2-1 TaxID=2916839 RepID=UPI001F5689EE|nr:phytochelatin synthase family protein [Lysobacter sp. M2-1]
MLQVRHYQPVEGMPTQLAQLSGPCGPASVWLVLSRHGISADPEEIISLCRYTDEFGAFAVQMVVALRHFGLQVRLHSDPDPAPHILEQEAYGRVCAQPAVSLSTLLKDVGSGASVIVSYLAYGGDGHFSPLAGAKANKLLLPYSIEGEMLRSEFRKRWRAGGILRQAIVAT